MCILMSSLFSWLAITQLRFMMPWRFMHCIKQVMLTQPWLTHLLLCLLCCVQQGGTLKAMRELLHAGERLGVGVAATAALRARIRRREWEDSARKALSTKSSVAALAGVFRVPAAGGPLTACCCTDGTAVWDIWRAA